MIRYVIAAILFFGCIGFANAKANGLKQRFQTLTELSNDIGRMAENVRMMQWETPVLLEKSAKTEAGILFRLLAGEWMNGKNGQQAWEAVCASEQNAVLRRMAEPEKTILQELAATLGTLDALAQHDCLKRLQQEMEQLRKSAETEMQKRSGTYREMGVLGAVAAVLLAI